MTLPLAIFLPHSPNQTFGFQWPLLGKGLGGTHPRHLRKACSLRKGRIAQEAAPAAEGFPQSSSFWPVSPFALPWPRLPSWVLLPVFPRSPCGLNFRVRIAITIFTAGEPLRNHCFPYQPPTPAQLYRWGNCTQGHTPHNWQRQNLDVQYLK